MECLSSNIYPVHSQIIFQLSFNAHPQAKQNDKLFFTSIFQCFGSSLYELWFTKKLGHWVPLTIATKHNQHAVCGYILHTHINVNAALVMTGLSIASSLNKIKLVTMRALCTVIMPTSTKMAAHSSVQNCE